jgi:mannose-6-phosphate isomerase
MYVYPYKLKPIYKDKIWGGHNLQRIFGRQLPPGDIGESWELADLPEGVSEITNGPAAGMTINQLLRRAEVNVLGCSKPMPDGRFPLLLKLLDANDILSLQVHPDEQAAAAIPGAALKTECWYIVESRNGFIYKGLTPGTTPEQFRAAIANNTVEQLVQRYDVQAGEFHYLPAGTVHALGAGVVVAEVQTPSDTTYRVTDWGRGREIHVELSMKCIHFTADVPPPKSRPRCKPMFKRETLLRTDYFTVFHRSAQAGDVVRVQPGSCMAIMILDAQAPLQITHSGKSELGVLAGKGETILLPAGLNRGTINASAPASWLEIKIP